MIPQTLKIFLNFSIGQFVEESESHSREPVQREVENGKGEGQEGQGQEPSEIDRRPRQPSVSGSGHVRQ